MQFSHTSQGGGKAGKLMLVAAVHVAIGALFIHSLDSRHMSLSKINEQVLVMLDPQRVDPPPPPPPPPMPPELLPKVVPPTLVVPEPEVPVAPPPDASPVHAATTPAPDTTPTTAGPAHALPDAAPGGAQAKANAGQARTAVLADPNACALPDYPARAARDGISGTTLLALLVGTDGRVTSSRIEHSSGSRDLDRAAVNALSLCRFKPATNNGVAEAGWAQLAYVWTLD